MSSTLEILSLLEPYADPSSTPASVGEVARSAEEHGIDRLLIGYGSAHPDGWAIAARVLALTSTIRVLLAHRPGIMHPVAAARMAATQQYLGEGRFAFNIVAGGAPGDQLREGDGLAKEERYSRASEYLDVMKLVWGAKEPVDFDGSYFRAQRAFLMQPPPAPIPIFMGGASGGALEFGVTHADTYMLWAEPLAETADRIREIESAASERGRPRPRISLSIRLIDAATNEAAWGRAEAFLATLAPRTSSVKRHANDVGRQRQLDIAEQKVRHDTNYWSGITLATAGQGNTAALVGTPYEILTALTAYRGLGIDTFLLTGVDGRWDERIAPIIERVRDELA